MIPALSWHAPSNFVFGPKVADRAGTELAALGAKRVLVVTGGGPTRASPGFASLLSSLAAAGVEAEVYAGVGHDPDAPKVEDCARAVVASGAEAVLAYGGGSPMDCAKAANLQAANSTRPGSPWAGSPFLDFVYGRKAFRLPGLPLVCLPTTAGTGSELSNAAVTIDPEADRKLGLSSPWFFPTLALVDPLLQATMGPELTAATGMDALTHALESFVSKRSSPLSRAVAGHAAGLVLASLEGAFRDGADPEARSAMALASSEVAMAFSQTGLGLVHGFAHPVGARGGVAHGLANAVILPWVSAACIETEPGAYAGLAAAAGLPTAGLDAREAAALLLARIREVSAAIGIPGRLSALGLSRDSLPAILADARGYRNRASSPRAFSDEELAALLEEMY